MAYPSCLRSCLHIQPVCVVCGWEPPQQARRKQQERERERTPRPWEPSSLLQPRGPLERRRRGRRHQPSGRYRGGWKRKIFFHLPLDGREASIPWVAALLLHTAAAPAAAIKEAEEAKVPPSLSLSLSLSLSPFRVRSLRGFLEAPPLPFCCRRKSCVSSSFPPFSSSSSFSSSSVGCPTPTWEERESGGCVCVCCSLLESRRRGSRRDRVEDDDVDALRGGIGFLSLTSYPQSLALLGTTSTAPTTATLRCRHFKLLLSPAGMGVPISLSRTLVET